jgi:enediyne polyketide synthase
VLAAVNPERLTLVLAFGSIIARMGLPGEAHYAVANDWLAELVDGWHRDHPHCRCLTLEWSVWAGVGMGQRLGRVDALAQQGVTPIPIDEGIRRMLELLTRPTPTRVVVAGRFGEPPTLKMEERELPLLRFVEHPRAHYPGVELLLDVDLSAEADPYLNDHVFAGAKLLPAVIGLEAMAQAAMTLIGSERPPTFENVWFNRPVVVPDGAAETIRLAALARTPGRVDVVLRGKQTAFQVDHFSATCVFEENAETSKRQNVETPKRRNAETPKRRNAETTKRRNDEVFSRDPQGSALPQPASESQQAKAGGPLPIDPERDLYGGILFQRGRFRRLRGYRRLRATECIAEIGPGGGEEWFGRYLPTTLVLGDPAARDAAIHAIQPCIPHARILPVGVDYVWPLLAETAGPRFAVAQERSRDGDLFIYDLDIVRADGVVCEHWEGLRLRIVEGTGPPEAWVEPLLGPYMERRVDELVPGAGVNVYVERAAEGERRERSDRAIERLLGASAPLKRRPDGKPDVAPDGRIVSAAHSGDVTMAVAACGPIGCDVEAVTPRSVQAWRDLLGAERYALAEIIARGAAEAFESAATRVWAAAECLKKAGAAPDAPLVFASAHGDGWVVLRSGGLAVATYAARVRGEEQLVVFAVAVEG